MAPKVYAQVVQAPVVQAQVVGQPVGVTAAQNKGYEDNPSFTCIYYNEKDPRVCVCGRDNLKCGAPAPVANLATRGGKGICFVLTAVPITLIIIHMIVRTAANDEFEAKCEAIQTQEECDTTTNGEMKCIWNSKEGPCICQMDHCSTISGGKKKQAQCEGEPDCKWDGTCKGLYSSTDCPNDDENNPGRLLMSANISEVRLRGVENVNLENLL